MLARYWKKLNESKENEVQCQLCPRGCKIKPGQTGLCFVRENVDGELVLNTYGKANSLAIDPIEKKPLNHFLPGSSILSMGTAGCNLNCKFCQNWDLTKSKERLNDAYEVSAESLVSEAKLTGCKSIAFTYNDPVIYLEFAHEIAELARANDLKTVAVTAGYINEKPREEFFSFIDAANIDLKSFSDDFYKRMSGGHLAPVLETLSYVKNQTDVWLEITNLLIPGENDSEKELNEMTTWIVENLGSDVPLHFSAFHPSYHLQNVGRTPISTLHKAREIALKNGIKYCYLGNVSDTDSQTTYCPNCNATLIERDWYQLHMGELDDSGRCSSCGTIIPGVFSLD